MIKRRKRAAHGRGRRRGGAQRGRWLRRALRLAGVTALLALVVVVAVQLWFLAHIVWWTRFDPGSTSFMRAQLERLRETRPAAELKHEWVPYARISPDLKRAVIAAEDARFTAHEGIDWEAIEKAYDDNRRKGKVVRGGSTITMQLAKNLFLSGSRSYLRKGQELVITYMLEAVMSKRRILEIYLNVAQWGEAVFGAEAAARHYYDLSAARIAPGQAATLASMLPRPRFYERNRDSAYLERRAALVRRWMGDVTPP